MDCGYWIPRALFQSGTLFISHSKLLLVITGLWTVRAALSYQDHLIAQIRLNLYIRFNLNLSN